MNHYKNIYFIFFSLLFCSKLSFAMEQDNSLDLEKKSEIEFLNKCQSIINCTGDKGMFRNDPLTALDILIYNKTNESAFNTVLNRALEQIKEEKNSIKLDDLRDGLNYIQHGFYSEGTLYSTPKISIFQWDILKNKAYKASVIVDRKISALNSK